MTIPSPSTKVHLDSGSDDPKQARAELATLVDNVNTMRSHLLSSAITSGTNVLGVGAGLAASQGNLIVNIGTGIGQIIQIASVGGSAGIPSGLKATQAELEAETANGHYISPEVMKHHPGVAKFWAFWDGTQAGPITPTADYNVTDITDNGTGDQRVNFDTAFSSFNYCPGAASSAARTSHQAVGTGYRIQTYNVAGSLADAPIVTAWGWGDQ